VCGFYVRMLVIQQRGDRERVCGLCYHVVWVSTCLYVPGSACMCLFVCVCLCV